VAAEDEAAAVHATVITELMKGGGGALHVSALTELAALGTGAPLANGKAGRQLANSAVPAAGLAAALEQVGCGGRSRQGRRAVTWDLGAARLYAACPMRPLRPPFPAVCPLSRFPSCLP
jgi:hypothetical protein